MNYYQASAVPPMAAVPLDQPSQAVIVEMRRGGFWASFLGWTTVMSLVTLILFAMNAPSIISAKPRAHRETKLQAAAASPLESGGLSPTPRRERVELPDHIKLLATTTVIVSAISTLATIGMIVMLIWFGASSKRLVHFPTYEQLHIVAKRQRWLWICIGMYCLCTIITLALFVFGSIGSAMSLMPR
jgi:uncharacterized membrane protein YhaH (DUF805 family)